MKIPKETMLIQTFKLEIKKQIFLLLDIVPYLEDNEDKKRVWAEISILRAKIKPYDAITSITMPRLIKLLEITLKSKMNYEDRSPIEPRYTFSYKQALATA